MTDGPRKVYLATAGEYSDYRVLKAFTSSDDAWAYPLGEALIYCKALSAYVGHGQMPDGRFVLMRIPEGML